jgi:hypothetical protein
MSRGQIKVTRLREPSRLLRIHTHTAAHNAAESVSVLVIHRFLSVLTFYDSDWEKCMLAPIHLCAL